jgi:hypothetical protein
MRRPSDSAAARGAKDKASRSEEKVNPGGGVEPQGATHVVSVYLPKFEV